MASQADFNADFPVKPSCLVKLDGGAERPWIVSIKERAGDVVIYAGVSEDGAHRIVLNRDNKVLLCGLPYEMLS